MKGTVVALGDIGGRRAAVSLRDGRIDDVLIDGDTAGPGAIFRAICDRPVKGAGGMFLRLPAGATAYLRQAKGMKTGQALTVQVTGYAEPGKALPVTDRVIFKSRYVIVTPGAPGVNVSRQIRGDEERRRLKDIADASALAAGQGLILRSRAAGAGADEIAADIAAMAAAAQSVAGDTGGAPELLLDAPDAHRRAWIDWAAPDLLDEAPGAFDRHGVSELLDEFRGPTVALGPATALVEPTRALVAVDVNTGNDASPAAGLKANIALARELPRQLRCRGLGGQITLDLAPMAKKDRHQWEQVLKAAFRADPIETALAGWTPLGHFELQRKRERLPLAGLI